VTAATVQHHLPALDERATKSREVFVIQVLRAVAAIVVILHHADKQTFSFGSIGVDVFFVVSGFVMIVSTVRLRTQDRAAWLFLRKRIIRIVPLYWIFTMAQLVRDRVVGLHHTKLDLLCSLLFIPYRNGRPLQLIYTPICGVGWSLNYEAFFYAAFALCLSLRKSPLWLLPVFAVLSLIGLHRPEQSIGVLSLFNYRLVLFASGMVVARLYMKRLMLPPVVAFIVLGAAIGCIGIWNQDSYFVHMVVWAPSALLGTYALLTFEPFVSRHMPAFLQLLGDASYSIYLSHLVIAFAFLHAVFSVFPRLHVLVSNSGYTCLRLVVACGIGILIHKKLEQPILRRFSVWIGGHRALP
jgi:exopolysaccharide production protein ExoZ